MRKKLRRVVVLLVCLAMVLGSSMISYAASYSYANEYDNLPENVKNNCVAFARYMVPSLPGGLIYKQDKINIINSYTPTVGSIAITHGNQPDYGHVAYVEAVNGNTITTLNGGYIDGTHIGRINGTPEEQGVIGYWNPNGGNITITLEWGNDDCQPDSSNVYVYTEANTNVSGSFTEAGITVWDEAGQVVATKSEASGVTGTFLKAWYNITNDTGVTLESGKNYTYQFYTVFNGQRYDSPIHSFRTAGPSKNTWTQELSIDDWTYGEDANTPVAAAQYGNVVFTYSTSQGGTYTAEAPQTAGTYYVKASVAGMEQYTGLEAVKEFHIYKAVPVYIIPEDVKAIYGQTLSDIVLPDGFVWSDVSEKTGNIGEKEFIASFIPEDTQNYSTVDDIKITVKVNPKDLSDIKLADINKDTDLNNYKVKDGENVLVKDVDYIISSKTEGNKVTVSVEFIGNYTGVAKTSYTLDDTIQKPKPDTDKTQSNDGTKNDSNNSGTKQELKPDTDKTQSNSETKKDNNNLGTKSNPNSNTPKTGDTSSVAVCMMMIVLSGIVGVVVLRKRKVEKLKW